MQRLQGALSGNGSLADSKLLDQHLAARLLAAVTGSATYHTELIQRQPGVARSTFIEQLYLSTTVQKNFHGPTEVVVAAKPKDCKQNVHPTTLRATSREPRLLYVAK